MKNMFKLVHEKSEKMSKRPHELSVIVTKMSLEWTNLNLFLIDATLVTIWNIIISLKVTH